MPRNIFEREGNMIRKSHKRVFDGMISNAIGLTMTSSGDWSVAGNGILRINTTVEIATSNAIPASGTARAGVTFWSATNFGILMT